MVFTGSNDANYSDWAKFLGNGRSHDLILGLHRSLSSGESGQTRGRAAQSQHAPSSDHIPRGPLGVAVGLVRARLCRCRVRPHQLPPNLLPNSLRPEPTRYLLNFVITHRVSLGGWVVEFLLRERNGAPFASGMVATGYWLGITAGRGILPFVTNFLGIKLAITVRRR